MTFKIALIPPYSLQEWTEKTDYQLCLPHLLPNKDYFVRYQLYGRDPHHFVILDNGAAEGRLVSLEVLMSHAGRLRPDEVVIPDAMGDKDETIRLAQHFHDEVIPPREFAQMPFTFMFVVQGQTIMEVLESANWAAQQYWIHTLGIPRHLVTTLDDPMARVRIANIIQGHNYPKQIHFLGGNPAFPSEVTFLSDPRVTHQDRVRGMDTSMPFNYACAGKSLLDAPTRMTEKVDRPDEYFYLPADRFDDKCVAENVEYFLQFHNQGVEAK